MKKSINLASLRPEELEPRLELQIICFGTDNGGGNGFGTDNGGGNGFGTDNGGGGGGIV